MSPITAYMSPATVNNVEGNVEGFDRFAGKRWIYPNNMQVRAYQRRAVEKALFTNAMIVLPTGFGKTFIAAVVMYNFHRWYPEGKIIFVAPTRPLVHQQIDECKKVSGIPYSECIELTGQIAREKRNFYWKEKRVFFATPQVIDNDLADGILPAKQVKCIVIDEAHRAQGGYAYVNIVQKLHQENMNGFRVLALSATPGSDMARVQQVMLNLYIGDIMFLSENSLELSAYRHQKMSKAWTVELSGKHKKILDQYVNMCSPIFKELHQAGLTYGQDSVAKVKKFTLITSSKRISEGDMPNRGKSGGRLKYLCFTAISLVHSFEMLTIYGLRPFYDSINKNMNKSKSSVKLALGGKAEFDLMLQEVKDMFGDYVEPDITKDPSESVDLTKSHPKLVVVRDLLKKHFEEKAGIESRAMVFSKYRISVQDIVQVLRPYNPLIKATMFVGQSDADGRGMSQKEQHQVIQEFKSGKYNVLVCTCVAEEGLDIGEVDLIICFDTSKSLISNTQRRGRTGRKRCGDVQTILTRDYEENNLKQASASKRQIEEQLYKRDNYMSHRYRDAPRLVPLDVKPICFEHQVHPVKDEEEEEKVKKPRKKRLKAEPTPEPKSEKPKCKELFDKFDADDEEEAWFSDYSG